MSVAAPRRWLILRLEAPLLSFGGVAIDAYGVTRDFPALSMLTGLFANALGYERTECDAHQVLQDRIVFAARRDDEPYHGVMRDVQNVHMQKYDKGWTTRGTPEGRDGGSYSGPHRRFRDYHPDALVAVVITLANASKHISENGRSTVSLDDLAAALDRPQRPLFIGRKSCLPACRLNAGMLEAMTAHEALSELPPLEDRLQQFHKRPNPKADDTALKLRAQWPIGEGPDDGPLVDHSIAIPDRRNWRSGLHGGTRRVVEGRVQPALRPSGETT